MTPLQNPLVAEFRFPALIPPLPSHTEGPDPVARATVARELPGGLELDGVTNAGARVRIALSFVAPGVARVELEPRPALEAKAQAYLRRRTDQPRPRRRPSTWESRARSA